jgi:Na+/melibiose symporter-like transporter
VTAGLAILVYAISKAPFDGWLTGRTLGLLALSAVFLVAFVVIETRTTAPLMPFSIFRNRSLTAANIVGVLFGAAIFANFFILTLYVQQVLHWSALKAGLTFLATAGTVVVWAGVSQALVTKFGPRPVLTIGLLFAGGTMLYYTTLPVHGRYWPDLLPPYLTFAFGMAFTFIPVTIAAFSGVEPRLAGLASGLLNTSQQVGGAIGVAVASTIFTTHANSLLKTGHSFAVSYTSGYHWAFFALAVTGFVAAAIGFVLLRNVRFSTQGGPAPATA